MDVLWCNCIFLLSVLFLILKFSAGLGIIENRMLSQKDVMIASSQTTIEHTVRSKLICATLCIRNGFCMAVSYKNTKCYVETETNFSVDPNIGAMTMRLAGGTTTKFLGEVGTTVQSPERTIEHQVEISTMVKSSEYTTIDDPGEIRAMHSSGVTTKNHPGIVGTTVQSPESTTEHQAEISTTTKSSECTMTYNPGEISTAMHSSEVMTNHLGEIPTTTQPLESATSVIQQGYVSSRELSFEGTTQHGYDSYKDDTSEKTLLDTQKLGYNSTFDKVSNETVLQLQNYSSEYFLRTTAASMRDAQIGCNILGGKLVEIETLEENMFMWDKFVHDAPSFAWIGGYDYNADSIYEWDSNPTESMSFTYWNRNEPRKPGEQLCVVIGFVWAFKWGSASCADLNPYYCEIEP